jgi:hypothetical protein
MARNAAKYTAEQLRRIKARIIRAWKDKIDSDGPPSAADDKALILGIDDHFPLNESSLASELAGLVEQMKGMSNG